MGLAGVATSGSGLAVGDDGTAVWGAAPWNVATICRSFSPSCTTTSRTKSGAPDRWKTRWCEPGSSSTARVPMGAAAPPSIESVASRTSAPDESRAAATTEGMAFETSCIQPVQSLTISPGHDFWAQRANLSRAAMSLPERCSFCPCTGASMHASALASPFASSSATPIAQVAALLIFTCSLARSA